MDQSIIFITLYHNFWTRNPNRSSKVSKDSDFSLVSNKNFMKILPSNSFGKGPGEVGQGGLKVLHLWCHSKNQLQPPTKKFFIIAYHKTCQVFWTFEQLSTAFGARVTLTQSHMQSGCFGV